jgi:hypothetical protein
MGSPVERRGAERLAGESEHVRAQGRASCAAACKARAPQGTPGAGCTRGAEVGCLLSWLLLSGQAERSDSAARPKRCCSSDKTHQRKRRSRAEPAPATATTSNPATNAKPAPRTGPARELRSGLQGASTAGNPGCTMHPAETLLLFRQNPPAKAKIAGRARSRDGDGDGDEQPGDKRQAGSADGPGPRVAQRPARREHRREPRVPDAPGRGSGVGFSWVISLTIQREVTRPPGRRRCCF